jgi:anhydro-N-acetylmuramic acid kinase
VIVAGVMSGTSADGINVALVSIRPGSSKPRISLLGHAEYPFPRDVRRAILGAMNAESASVAELSRLNFLLGELYAEAVARAQKQFRVKASLVGCHGQTIYHQGDTARFLGRNLATTWQTGEAAVIAARLRTAVVSDFRPADMAVGGKGAPLVPFLDYMLWRDARIGRIVQNIGGIANLTMIPAGANPHQVIAFDTGPGNMVIDAVSEKLFHRAFDQGGKLAAGGKMREAVVSRVLSRTYFRRRPPKTAGREEFGREFVAEFIRQCGKCSKRDVIATATALTAGSIADSIQRFAPGKGNFRELVVSGGGTKNLTLMRMLRHDLKNSGLKVRTTEEFGIPTEAKEALAFAVLAHETWHGRPSNLPSATGARRPAVLGKISHA